jgi:putative heme iron utilization protein
MRTPSEKKDVLRPVDEASRRQAKQLIRTARFAALACLAPGNGAPLASQVNVVADSDGAPGFLISALSPHFAALEADPRCALLFGTPGKGDPAAHPRVSVNGTAERLSDPAARARFRRRFLARHPKAGLYVDFGDFAFWRVRPHSASLNGGFGKAYEMAPTDILSDLATCPGLEDIEADAVAHMNADHADAVALYATELLGQPAGAWLLANIDGEGMDLVSGDLSARLWFEPPLENAAALRGRLAELARTARDKT